MSLENAILVGFSTHEAVEQGILDALRSEGRPFVALDLEHGRLHRSDMPGWTQLFFASKDTSAYLRRCEIIAAIDGSLPHQVFCVGLDAASTLPDIFPDVPTRDVLLTEEDVAFGGKRAHLMAKLDAVVASYPRAFCLNEYLFGMLADKGSNIPHFLLDVDPRCGEGVSLEPAAKSVGLVRGRRTSEAQCHSVMTMIRRRLPGYHVRVIDYDDLFAPSDAAALRPVHHALQSSFSDLGGLVFLEYGRNLEVLLRAVAPAMRNRVVVVDNFNLRNAVWDIPSHFELAPVYALADALARGLELEAYAPDDSASSSVSEQLRRAAALVVPDFHEDLRALRQDGPLDVYFSTTPVETHNRGARAKRVRSMLLALRESGAVIELTSSLGVLQRRLLLLEAEVAQGRQLRLFYGENSTSPIPNLRALGLVADLVRLVRSQGGKAGWFIRDLHFMSQEVWSASDREDLIRRACMEFSVLSEEVDIFYAPSGASLQMFRNSLPRPARTDTRWGVLQPGLGGGAPASVRQNSPASICFVYTGGLGSVYAMDDYLEAVRRLHAEPGVQFDFVVRDVEKHHLDVIANLSGNVRIQAEDFDYYVSDAARLFGVSLLESGYADAAFPVKLMDYLCRGIPVLYYQNASYGDFLKSNGVGWMVKRSADGVEAALREIITRARAGRALVNPESIENVQRANSWLQRAAQVRQDLAP